MWVPTYHDDERNQKNVIVYRWVPAALGVEDTNTHPKLTTFEQEVGVRLSNLLNVPGFLAEHSHLIPLYMKYFVARMEVGTHDTLSVAPWYDQFHYRNAFPNQFVDSDFLFTTHNDGRDSIVEAINFISEKLDYFAKEKQQYPIMDAIYIRFIKGTNHGLSTSFTENIADHKCGLDMVSDGDIPGYPAFITAMEKFFFRTIESSTALGENSAA